MPSASDAKIWGIVLVWLAAAALFCLHQDFWLWDNRRLIFGFLPVGLGYHAVFSMLAAALWAMAIRLSWPDHLEKWASPEQENDDSKRLSDPPKDSH